MKLISGIYLFLILFVPISAFTQVECFSEIYVSTNGNDSNDGQIETPFATINKALDYSRLLKESCGKDKKIEIILREGTYHLNASIQLDHRDELLSIRSYKGESVVFSGSKSISISYIQKKNNIYEVDLTKAGISDYGKIRKVGFGRPYGAAWGELFINKRAFHLARYPNEGMLQIKKVLDAGSVPRSGDYSNRGGTFSYKGSHMDKWANETDPWIGGYFMWGYADDMIPVSKIDSISKTIETGAATMYGFGDKKPFRKWYGINLKSELDTAMEYFVDRQSGKLYFMSDEALVNVEFSMLEMPFFQIQNSRWITIKGIIFENARGIGISTTNTHNLIIEDCIFQNLGSLGLTMGLGITPFEDFQEKQENVETSGIVGSLPQYMYKNTVFDRKSGNENIIRNCIFRHLGAGGVSLGGGDRITLSKGNNRVENCIFYDNNRIEKSYRAAIYMNGVGNVISHCEIFNTPGAAILLNGNEHIIEYNYIHNVATEVNDLGAIYYGRDPSERGIIIRYNVISEIPAKFLTAGIYHDDGACGLTAYSNVLINAGQRSVLMGGGSDNKYFNNLFIGKEAGIFIDDRLRTWAKNLALPDTGLYAQRFNAVNINSKIYKLTYPTLQHYFEGVPHPRNNLTHRNVFINFKRPLYAKKKSISWRKWAIGYSRENVIKKDSNIMKTLMIKGINAVIDEYSNILKSIPIKQIGPKPADFIPTVTSKLGIQQFDIDN